MELQKSTFNPIYMGSKIDYKGDALEMTVGPKGQIVNKVMADHQKQFGERIIEVTPGVHVSVGRGLGNCTMVEGKRNPLEFKEKPSKEVILTLPYDTFVRMLRFKMDQRKLWDIDKVVTFEFTDIEKSCSLHIRKGIVEYLDETDRTDVKLTMTFDSFSELIQGESLSGKVESGSIVVEGDCQTCDEVIALLA